MDDKTYLVASPRCGGHWLITMIQSYFSGMNVKNIVFRNKQNMICHHTHDGRLLEKYEDVIYLYRDPIDKIYSEMSYYNNNIHYRGKIHFNRDINDKEKIILHTKEYAKHMMKWIFDEKFTKKKTIISYDFLVEDLEKEFSKICNHFYNSFDIDDEKIKNIKNITKQDVKKRIYRDSRVVRVEPQYNNNREVFREKNYDLIKNTIISYNHKLAKFLSSYFNK